MSSIRPLFTIAVLVVVGAYLYWKINEGPTRPRAGTQAASNQIGDGIPPLAAASSGATLSQDSAAPAWPPASSDVPPAAPAESTKSSAPPADAATDTATSSGASVEATTKNALPDVPPIPELPELPSTTGLTTTPTAPATQPTTQPTKTSPPELPINNSDPRYGDAAGSTAPRAPGATASALTITGSPAAPAASTPPTTTNTLPIGSTDTAPGGPTSPPLEPLGSATTSPPTAPQFSLPNPAPSPSAGTQPPDRYAPGDNSANPPALTPLGAAPAAPSVPVVATFAASWPAIQAALDGGDLKQAHQLLSRWHGNDSLTPAESEKVETLLGQLAGTVIYSTEHQLEPARVVKTGETLDTIAKEYNVPSQLLAKINNITAPEQLRPGQQLKVVRGPFTATVDLRRSELSLEVDGRYAGTFPITVPAGLNVAEGQWLVDQKLDGSQSAAAPASYSAPPVPADRTIILRNATPPGAVSGSPVLAIASSSSSTQLAGATAIRVAPQDAEDLSDILSIGSRVVVRR